MFFQLPDAFQDLVGQLFGGKRPSEALMTHCKRELMHAQWDILLDGDFLEAYRHGIVMECYDAVVRRFYPRFFYLFSRLQREVCQLSFLSVQTCSYCCQGYSLQHTRSRALSLPTLSYPPIARVSHGDGAGHEGAKDSCS